MRGRFDSVWKIPAEFAARLNSYFLAMFLTLRLAQEMLMQGDNALSLAIFPWGPYAEAHIDTYLLCARRLCQGRKFGQYPANIPMQFVRILYVPC